MAARDRLRLCISVDQVAVLRNARGNDWPDPLRAALLAEASGADGISARLRADRRDLSEADIEALAAGLGIPLHLNAAPVPAMLGLLTRLRPASCCLVAGATDGSRADICLDILADEPGLRAAISTLREAGTRTALLIGQTRAEIEAAARSGAQIVVFHTGAYSIAHAEGRQQEAERHICALHAAAVLATGLGLEAQAAHGLTYENIDPVAAIPELREVHIGHFLIGEAVYIGLGPAIEEMRRRIDAACQW